MHEVTTTEPGRELLSFRLGQQEFCIDVMAVREIRGWTQETPLPHAPSFVRGVVNLRGAVIPIIDLGERLGLAPAEAMPQSVIIVAQIGSQLVGLLVSAVCDIINAASYTIQPTPEIAAGPTRTFMQGLLTVEDRMVGVLRTDQLVPAMEMEMA
jgi:purine-binding chemotaxis protein CheW